MSSRHGQDPLNPVARAVGFVGHASAGAIVATTSREAINLPLPDAADVVGTTMIGTAVLLWWLHRYMPDSADSVWDGARRSRLLLVFIALACNASDRWIGAKRWRVFYARPRARRPYSRLSASKAMSRCSSIRFSIVARIA